MNIKLKRVYDPFSKADGTRILVERLWPRGIKKEALIMDTWLKEIAPSSDLRKWFSHDPEKWEEFQKRYRAELENNKEALDELLSKIKGETLTLLYSARDEERNSAIILKQVLEKKP